MLFQIQTNMDTAMTAVQDSLAMVEQVRGKGLLNAVIIKPKNGKEAWDVCVKMKELGVLAKPTHQHIIRFAPPLVITEEQLRDAISRIKEAILSFN